MKWNPSTLKYTKKERKKERSSKFLWDKSNEINEAIFTCSWSYVRTSRSRYQSPSPQVVIRPLGVRSFVRIALFTARIKIENELWPPVPDRGYHSNAETENAPFAPISSFILLTLLLESLYFFNYVWKVEKFFLFLRFRNFEMWIENHFGEL